MSFQSEEQMFYEKISRNKDIFNYSPNKNNNYLWSEVINENLKIEIQERNKHEDLNCLINKFQPKSILDNKFLLIKKIGQGSSSKVYLGLSIESLSNNNSFHPKFYSIKIMTGNKINMNEFQTEIKLLEKINHDNVLKLYGYGFGQKKSLNKEKAKSGKEVYYLVLEYLEHDELLKYIIDVIQEENIGFGEEFGRLIFAQLLDGLESMHNLNITHRDIKPNNIMLGGENYTIKYVDFGYGTDQAGILNVYLGTPNYSAPELHLKRPYYGKPEDIFSLGVMLFVLVTGYLPFKLAVPNDSLYQYIIRGDYIEFWKNRNVNVSPSFMELFDNMVAFDYCQRPSISEIRESPWMKEINWNLLPYLKQEFILREKNIKQNEQKNKEINKINNEPIFSLLDPTKHMKNLDSVNNNSKNHATINDDTNTDSFHVINNNISSNNNESTENKNNNEKIVVSKIENSKNKKNKKNKGIIIIKSRSKTNQKVLLFVQRFLKKKGYIPVKQSFDCNELEITDGEVDVLLKIKKLQGKQYKIKYFKVKGMSDDFEMFSKAIKLLKGK